MSSPTKLGSIVTQNSTLKQLFRQANEQRRVDEKIKSFVDDSLAPHIRSALFRDGDLILIVDSSTWAAKLRYQVADIHARIAADETLDTVGSIRVKIGLTDGAGNRENRGAMAPMSLDTAGAVRTEAAAIRDPKLREALNRLTNRSGN